MPRHHYLSRVYLEGFLPAQSPGGAVVPFWVRRGERSFPSQPSAVASIGDYYSLPASSPDREAVEVAFSRIESETTAYLRSLDSGAELAQGATRSWVSLFVAMHLIRVPSARTRFEALFLREAENSWRELVAGPGLLEARIRELGLATEESVADLARQLRASDDADFDMSLVRALNLVRCWVK